MVCCHLPPFCANQDWCYTREAWWKWEWGKCLLAGPPPTVVQIAYWARLLLRGRVGAETQPELHLAKPCALPWGSILQEKGMPFLMHKKTVYISGSRIWYFHCSILGGCYGAGLIPGPGPFILHGCSQKKKKDHHMDEKLSKDPDIWVQNGTPMSLLMAVLFDVVGSQRHGESPLLGSREASCRVFSWWRTQ